MVEFWVRKLKAFAVIDVDGRNRVLLTVRKLFISLPVFILALHREILWKISYIFNHLNVFKLTNLEAATLVKYR